SAPSCDSRAYFVKALSCIGTLRLAQDRQRQYCGTIVFGDASHRCAFSCLSYVAQRSADVLSCAKADSLHGTSITQPKDVRSTARCALRYILSGHDFSTRYFAAGDAVVGTSTLLYRIGVFSALL
ncbi:unnamed protein product, partial [Laminaria digitata]